MAFEQMRFRPDPRPTTIQLLHEAQTGKNIYQVIKGVLIGDTERLRTLTEQTTFLRAGGRSMEITPGSDEFAMFQLYKLTPNLTSPYFHGFSYVGYELYPFIVHASQPIVKEPTSQEFFQLPQETQKALLEANEQALRFWDLKGLAIRETFSRDVTGAEWLEKQVAQNYRDDQPELLGANAAITGIRKLHAELMLYS